MRKGGQSHIVRPAAATDNLFRLAMVFQTRQGKTNHQQQKQQTLNCPIKPEVYCAI